MAANTGWRRYGTKLRHRRRVYCACTQITVRCWSRRWGPTLATRLRTTSRRPRPSWVGRLRAPSARRAALTSAAAAAAPRSAHWQWSYSATTRTTPDSPSTTSDKVARHLSSTRALSAGARNSELHNEVLFCSFAVLDLRFGHAMDVLSPFILVLCHFDWLFHGEPSPRLDVVHLGRAWPSSPACTWHCSLQYLFLQATALFTHFSMFLTPALTKPYTPTNIITPTVTTGNESVPKIIKVAQ